MMKQSRLFSLARYGLLGAAMLVPGTVTAAPVVLTATLSGASETGGGDPDGSGSFTVEMDAGAGDFCYSLKATKIGKFTAAHVHSGAAGSDGPPVVTIDLAEDMCVAAEPDVLRPIAAAPASYYVNVHSDEFPKGAVRGQLAVK
jgi:CHRD domain